MASLLLLAGRLVWGDRSVLSTLLSPPAPHAVNTAPSIDSMPTTRPTIAAAPVPSSPFVDAAESRPPADNAEKGMAVWVIRTDRDRAPDHARIFIWGVGPSIESLNANAAGVAMRPASTGEADAVITSNTLPPLRTRIPLAEGRKTIRLPAGAVVSGTLMIDGAPGRSSLDLRSEKSFPGLGDVPAEVNHQGLNSSWLGMYTAADGSFRFGGLPLDWSGTLSWGTDFELAEDPPVGSRGHASPHELDLSAPVSGFILRLKHIPAVTGRVVAADGVTPVKHARVTCIYKKGGAAAEGGYLADMAGRFRAASDSSSNGVRFVPDALSLTVADVDGGGARTYDFAADIASGGGDVGDLRIADIKTIVLEIVDEAGAPVRNAFVDVGEGRNFFVKDVDAEGHVSVSVAASERIVGVAAPNKQIQRVPLTSATPSPHRIVLMPSTTLIITLKTRNGEPAAGVEVRLEGERGAFGEVGRDPFSGAFDPLLQRLGSDGPHLIDSVDGRDVREFVGGVNGAGTIALPSLKSGRYRARFHDALRAIDEEAVIDVREGVTTCFERTFDVIAKRVVVIVRDEAGAVVENITAMLTRERFVPDAERRTNRIWWVVSPISDVDGKLTFDPVYASVADVEIIRRDAAYQRVTRQDVRFPEDGSPIEITVKRKP